MLAVHLDRWEATLAYFRDHELLPEADPSLARIREMMVRFSGNLRQLSVLFPFHVHFGLIRSSAFLGSQAAVRARPAFQRTSQPAEYYIWAERRTRQVCFIICCCL